MQLHRIQDSRDNLEKARRQELLTFAKAHKIAEVDREMPATLIRKILRGKGLIDIKIRPQTLGQSARPRNDRPTKTPEVPVEAEPEAVTVDADDDLMRQYKAQLAERLQAPRPEVRPVPVPAGTPDRRRVNEMAELRKAAKALGIVVPRRAKKDDIRRLLDAKNAA